MLDVAEIGENAPRIYEAVFTYDWQSCLPRIKAPMLFVQVDSHTEPVFCKRAAIAKDYLPGCSVFEWPQSDPQRRRVARRRLSGEDLQLRPRRLAPLELRLALV